MKQFRIVKEKILWRKEYYTFFYVEERIYLGSIPLWWYRHVDDHGYFSTPQSFETEEKAMQYIKDHLEFLKRKIKKKIEKEVVKVITVDKDFNIKGEN